MRRARQRRRVDRRPVAVRDERPEQVDRGETGEALSLAYAEFMTIPTIVVAAFMAIAAATYWVDRAELAPHRWAARALFQDREGTSALLQVVAGSVLTITSITFSLLLVALQQSSAAFTAQVFDQYLRRRLNQLYFGLFIGIGLFSLVTLATIGDDFTPAFGALVALVLAILAVLVLLVLLYTTINQMRPAIIIESIHDHTVEARVRQTALLDRTRPDSRCDAPVVAPVPSDRTGFVVDIDIDALDEAVARCAQPAEVELLVAIGGHIGYHEPVAIVRAQSREDAQALAEATEAALRRERQRHIHTVDAAYGIEQLETIGWTCLSSGKQDPHAGLIVVANLRDVLFRWAAREEEPPDQEGRHVVYRDNVPDLLMDAFETLAAAAMEGRQHQGYAEVLHALARAHPRLRPELRTRAEEIVLRTLPALDGAFLPARRLERALADVARTFEQAGRTAVAARIVEAARSARPDLAPLTADEAPDAAR